ncbi:unnamed protein product [Pleuronectes platessa]|uniref:Uncharacterized protein n=1 Tax=Pleuronectes platessa TaxID=8262 RepID=A0A9N7TIA9_PLEPL|nr:unnamed protein product [Pleuronectes platessa]
MEGGGSPSLERREGEILVFFGMRLPSGEPMTEGEEEEAAEEGGGGGGGGPGLRAFSESFRVYHTNNDPSRRQTRRQRRDGIECPALPKTQKGVKPASRDQQMDGHMRQQLERAIERETEIITPRFITH